MATKFSGDFTEIIMQIRTHIRHGEDFDVSESLQSAFVHAGALRKHLEEAKKTRKQSNVSK